MTTVLSARLRTETADLHRRAERSGIMQGMLKGRMQRTAYVDLLRNFHVVYQAMEESLVRHAEHPHVKPFRSAALDRVPSLVADLVFLHGPDWATAMPASGAALEYGRRVRAATPELLVAHAYVRYLGDLSGGQMLKKVVGRGLGLAGTDGLAFYNFPGIPDPDDFKQRFRASLDALALAPELEDRVVTEARDAFGLNVNLFEAVATQTPASDAPAPPHGGYAPRCS